MIWIYFSVDSITDLDSTPWLANLFDSCVADSATYRHHDPFCCKGSRLPSSHNGRMCVRLSTPVGHSTSSPTSKPTNSSSNQLPCSSLTVLNYFLLFCQLWLHHENQHHCEQCWTQLHRVKAFHLLDQWVKIFRGSGVTWLWPHITVVAGWMSGKMETWFYSTVSLRPSIHKTNLKTQGFWSWYQRTGI